MPAHESARGRDDDLHPTLEVAPSADDILYLTADIHSADTEFVGVRMREDFLDHADDNSVIAAREFLHALDLDGGHGEIVGEALQVELCGEIDEIFYPVE